MKSNKNTVVMVSGIIAGAVLVLLAFLLYREIGKLKAARDVVDRTQIELKSFYGRDPFPSPENVVSVRNNLKLSEDNLSAMLKSLAKNQSKQSPDRQPLEWLTILTRTQKDLTDRAATKGISVPANFSFGFDRYADGTPPSQADVPRLSRQLDLITQLILLSYECGTKELKSVVRDEFEAKSGAAYAASRDPGDGGGGVVTNSGSELYSTENLSLSLGAREVNVVQVLNSMASNKNFIVVSKVHLTAAEGVVIEKEEDASVPKPTRYDPAGKLEAADEPQGKDMRPKEERVVSGRSKEQPHSMDLELTVFYFKDGLKNATSGGDATTGPVTK